MKKYLLFVFSVTCQLLTSTLSTGKFSSISDFDKIQNMFEAGLRLDSEKDLIQTYDITVEIITGEDGSFIIQNLARGKLQIFASSDGYVSFSQYEGVTSSIPLASDVILPPRPLSRKGLGKIQQNKVSPGSFLHDGMKTIVAGVLRDSETDIPIPKGKVILQIKGQYGLSGTSRLSGQFDLLSIPQGNYDLFISSPARNLPGELKGIIRDKDSGEPVPFANVVILDGDKIVTGAAADHNGLFIISNLKPGVYDLLVSSVGFQSEQRKSLHIESGKSHRIEIDLQLGIYLQEVLVQESLTPLIKKDGGGCYFCCCCCRIGAGLSEIDSSAIDDSKLLLTERSISLYPNPASSQITLDLSRLEDEPLSLRILDGSGRIALEQKSVPLSKVSIPLDRLSDGVYFASVQLKDELLTERFILAR